MEIKTTTDGGKTTLIITGRLDTTTSPELENALDGVIAGATELVLDFSGVEYISSAGLRTLLKAQKAISGHGTMKIMNAGNSVMEVFSMTGFADILTIE